MMLVEERIGLWRFLPIYASLRHSEEPAEGENRGSYFMVTYDGAPGELMIGIKEEHHELIGVVVSSYLCLNHPGTHKMIRWSKRREL